MNQMRVDLPNLVRWRSTLPVAVAVLALVPSTVLLAAMQGPDDPLKADVAGPSRPPRALLRIGTDDLRMNDRITALAFSADGRHLAAASGRTGSADGDLRRPNWPAGQPARRAGECPGLGRVCCVLAGWHEIAVGRIRR